MGNPAMTGMTIGTVIMPGAGTVIGAATGGLVGLFSGPDAQQQSANVGGRTIDARQIWEQIHGGNSDSLHQGASAATSLQSVHDDRAGQIDEINKAMDAAWQGDASMQVQAGAHPLGVWLRDSASNLQKSGSYLTSQGEAFDSAHGKVQEIASTPPHAGFMDHMNPFSDKDDEINKYNEQGQTNVQAFQAYYQASAQNAAGMPQYSAWQGNNFSEGKDKNDHSKDPTDHTSTLPTQPGGNYPPANIGTPPGIGNDGKLSQYGTHLPGTGDGNGSGNGSGQDGNQTGYPGLDDLGTKTPNWNDGTTAAGYTPSTSGTDLGSSSGFGPAGSGYGGLGGGLGSGSGSGSGGSGAGGAGALGGFGPGGSGSLGAGASTGAGGATGAGAGRGGVGAGAAGAAGRSGTSGMGGMGRGGQGKGGDDDEHQTKYLVSEDPNELFGTDELTAPPVIGE
ncbi:DUF1269 domain-containing protein [Amycolatopsis acidiphila]|nr:DUF1269 domain-containing protein [Amycolatopsis acidiphila]UIJ60097.1 DUF1269 domain-containing protein [Amycolatopsis acidiphila]